jgi:TonB family protein
VLLLARIAINALVEAGIGVFTYVANNEQLRNLAFWRLGSVGGASWTILAFVAPAIGAAMLVVDADGRAEQVDLYTSSGSQRLDAAALEAVRRWRFVPARQGDRAVAAWVLVPLSFRLES